MAEKVPNICLVNVELFARKLNVYRGNRGRDTTRRLMAPGWPRGRFGEDIDDLDSAFQKLRDRYGDTWLERAIRALEAENQPADSSAMKGGE